MDDESTGGEAACWAHLLCEECGVMTGEPHRDWCSHYTPERDTGAHEARLNRSS